MPRIADLLLANFEQICGLAKIPLIPNPISILYYIHIEVNHFCLEITLMYVLSAAGFAPKPLASSGGMNSCNVVEWNSHSKWSSRGKEWLHRLAHKKISRRITNLNQPAGAT